MQNASTTQTARYKKSLVKAEEWLTEALMQDDITDWYEQEEAEHMLAALQAIRALNTHAKSL